MFLLTGWESYRPKYDNSSCCGLEFIGAGIAWTATKTFANAILYRSDHTQRYLRARIPWEIQKKTNSEQIFISVDV